MESLSAHHGPGWIECRLPGDWRAALLGKRAEHWAAFTVAALTPAPGARLPVRLKTRLARSGLDTALDWHCPSNRRSPALLVAPCGASDPVKAFFFACAFEKS